MAIDLTGRTALVTGGARRLGRCIALALARAGANVVIHRRSSAAEAEALAEDIRGLGRGAWTVEADLRSDAHLEALVDRALEAAGALDILVNNAAVFPEGRLAMVTFGDLIECVRVNAWAPLELTRRFAGTARRGHVVNLLDVRAAGLDRSHAAYQASKHMLALFTRLMAIEFAPGIAVNAVAPGLILADDAPMSAGVATAGASLPLRRAGTAQDVADAVLFLVGCGFVTGQVIHVDGGRHARDAGGG